MPEVVITIPAYNEEKSIGKVVNDLQSTISTMLPELDFRIMVVSDGSTDKTIEEASKAGATVFNKDHSGLADTFRYEMEKALEFEPEYIVHTDADGQYTAVDVCKLIQAIKSGRYDLVLGNRLDGRIEYMPISKKLFNRAGSLFFSMIIGKYIPDMTTGLRAFTTDVAKMKLYSEHTYTVEQIIKARIADYDIKSVMVSFMARKDGKSRLMKTPLHYLWNTAKNWDRMFKL